MACVVIARQNAAGTATTVTPGLPVVQAPPFALGALTDRNLPF